MGWPVRPDGTAGALCDDVLRFARATKPIANAMQVPEPVISFVNERATSLDAKSLVS